MSALIDYCYLLIMSEYFSLRETENIKKGVIKKAARILIQGFESRFPITNSMVAAALLDPSVQHIEAVSTWLFDNNKTRSEVLLDAMTELRINREPHNQHHNYHQNSMVNHHDDIRLKLLKKHSVFTSSSDNDIEYEINNFFNIKDEVTDVLQFWRTQESNYPIMAKVANVLLCKPASSAKSESAFSAAGALLSKKRAHIEPLRAQKILFIHDNYNICKNGI